MAALLPFPTCLFQESYTFFLGVIENKDPPLSISPKEFPFTSHLVPVILCTTVLSHRFHLDPKLRPLHLFVLFSCIQSGELTIMVLSFPSIEKKLAFMGYL